MENVFEQEIKREFSWSNLGDIKTGREELGEEVPVIMYRLLHFTVFDVLCSDYGKEKANDILRRAGHVAGAAFANNVLDLDMDFNPFVSHLQEALKNLKVGVLRLETFNPDNGEIVLTVGQDLDCSGLPVTSEHVCVYDEGFISGILEMYTGKKYAVQEIDCWASGDRVCRFKGVLHE